MFEIVTKELRQVEREAKAITSKVDCGRTAVKNQADPEGQVLAAASIFQTAQDATAV